MPDYNGVTWRVNYGEIAERNQFRVGYIGQQSFDGYFELAQLADLIAVLAAVQSAPLNQLTKGSTVQARKSSDGVVTRVIIEPRSDTFPPQIMSLGLTSLADLIYALQLFQAATPGEPIPDDWDFSYQKPFVWVDKKGILQPPNNAIAQATAAAEQAKTDAESARDGAVAAKNAADAAARQAFIPRRVVHLADYGAKFDVRPAALTATAASTTLTSADAAFTADDVGKVVFIPGAGPTGTPYYGALVSTIASVTNATTAALSGNATASVAAVAGFVGTNNDTAWQDAFDDLAVGGGTILLPAGDGLHAVQKTPPSNVRIVGAGRDITIIHPVGSVNGFYRVGSAVDPLINTHFADLTVDGDMQTNGDGAGAKGFGLYFQVGCSYTDVTVKNTAGSGFGNDSHQDTWYVRCIAENCGRVGTTSSPGHSGFGFGMGGWAVDNVYLIDCIGRNNKRHGAFFEFQPGTAFSPTAQPAGAQIIGGRFEGNGVTGVSDQNVTGLIVIGAHIVDNAGQGFSVTTTSAVDNIAVDGLVTDCVITGNALEGIDLAWTHPNTLPSYGRYRILNNLVSQNGGQGIQVRAAASRTLDMIEVRGNTVRANYKNGIRAGGGTFVRSRITDNLCVDNGQGSDGAGGGLTGPDRGGISIQTAWTDGEISRNFCTDSRASGKSQAYGVLVNASGNIGTIAGNSLVSNNELRGNSTQALGGLPQISGSTIVRGNTGMSGAINPLTLTGSPMTKVCGVQNEEHFLTGGTITAVSVNGTALGAMASISGLVLTPGDTLTVTYSSTPTWKYRTFQNES